MQLKCYYDTSVIKPNKKPLTIYRHICLATVTSGTIIVSFWNSYFSYCISILFLTAEGAASTPPTPPLPWKRSSRGSWTDQTHPALTLSLCHCAHQSGGMKRAGAAAAVTAVELRSVRSPLALTVSSAPNCR